MPPAEKDIMKADAIIFDKDGTLLDFDAFWIPVSVGAVEKVFKEFGAKNVFMEEVLLAFGVTDGVTSIEGVLCKGTYAQMGKIVFDILTKHGVDCSLDAVVNSLVSAYNENFDAGEIRPVCPDLVSVLSKLKEENIRLAVVTTDNEEITRKCLKELHIEHLFDKIYTDDGVTPTKPDPYAALDFCGIYGLDNERVIMVGDTLTDVNFARNAGLFSVCLEKSEENRKILEKKADVVISQMSQLCDVLE